MKEFFQYFFGKGSEVEFTNFSLAHFLPILLMLAAIFAIYHYRDKIRNSKQEENLRYALAFALIITEMSYFWRLVGVPSLNPNPVDHLPITVCGWAVIFSSFMIVGKKQTLFALRVFHFHQEYTRHSIRQLCLPELSAFWSDIFRHT